MQGRSFQQITSRALLYPPLVFNSCTSEEDFTQGSQVVTYHQDPTAHALIELVDCPVLIVCILMPLIDFSISFLEAQRVDF